MVLEEMGELRFPKRHSCLRFILAQVGSAKKKQEKEK